MDNIRYKTNLVLGFSIMCLMVPIMAVGSSFLAKSTGVSGLTAGLLFHPAYLGSVLVGTILYFLTGLVIRSKKWIISILAFGTILLSFFLSCWLFLFHTEFNVENPGSFSFMILPNPGIEELIIYTSMVLAVFWFAEWIFLINFRKMWLLNILIIVVFMSIYFIVRLPDRNQFLVFGLASSYAFTIAMFVTLLTFLTDLFSLLFWEFSSRGKDLKI